MTKRRSDMNATRMMRVVLVAAPDG